MRMRKVVCWILSVLMTVIALPLSSAVRADAEYTMTGMDFYNAYYVEHWSEGWDIDEDANIASCITWKDNVAPAASKIEYNNPNLCSDAKCLHPYNGDIFVDASYYICYKVFNAVANDESIDFSQVEASNCSLDNIPGFDIECFNVKQVTSEGKQGVEVYFKLTREVYELEYFYAHATVSSNPSGFWVINNKYDASEYANWFGCDAPVSDYEVIANGLYTNSQCSSSLNSEPVGGGEYYAQYSVTINNAGDESYDISTLTKDDCILNVTGYKSECVKVENFTNLGGRECLLITFKLTKDADYIMTGLDAYASGLIRAGDYHMVDYSGSTEDFVNWKDDKAPSTEFHGNISSIFSDEACSCELESDLLSGYSYYMNFQYVYTPGKQNMDFSRVDTDDCSFYLPGYDTECISVNESTNSDGWYIVTITFKLTKQIYTLDNVRAFGDGLTKSGSNYYVKNASSTYNAFNWEDPYDEPLDSAFSGDNTQIYTDAACTKPLTSQPVYETYYYMKYRIWNTLPKDHSLDFTKVTEKDCVLFISGYTVECYSADLIVDGTGRDELDVTFRMTRNLSASMSGFDPVATRVKEESGVIYKPQIENIASFISWKNDVAGNERDYTIMTQGLYTDSACTNRLRNEPAMGVTYYLSYVITGRIPEPDLTINSLTVADCSLTIPGYSTTCLGVTKTTDSNNCDKLEVKFSITRQEAVPEYVMDGFAAKANGVVASGSSYKLNIDSAIKSFVLWQDGVNAPASDYAVENTSRLFTSSACTVGITSQPAPGDEVYAEFTVTSLKSRDIIDLSKVVNDKCTLTVPGYQTEFVRAIRSNTGIDQDSLQIVFKLTCQYSMTGMAMISSGVSYYEADNQYRINNTDVMRDHATWMDGSEPAFNDFTGILTCLYTDKDCKNILHSRPEAGKSYYAYALFYNEKDNDHSVGLTGITADNCTLDVDGYETRCVDIRNAVFASTHDAVYITFKLTKLERYTMTSFTSDASELVKYSSGYFLKSVSDDYSWDGDIAPAHDAVIRSDYPVVDNNETPISDMLAPGSTAYAYVVLSNKTPGDHTIDFSAMDTDDCVITMDGYDIECIAASEDTNERGCDCFMMIFEVTRLIPDGYYVMSGFEAEALGFVLNGGSVMLDTPAYEAFRALWKDAAPVLNTDYQVAANGIYTDEEGTEWLKHIPSESETFYVQFLVNNAKDGDTTIDLSQFNTTNCTFDVDGYTTECIRVERKTVGGLDSVYITFEVTKNEPDHNMDGFNIEASGVSLDGSNYVLDLPSDLKSCVTWCEDPAPDASQFSVTVSGLYTDEELTVPLTEKPVNGGEYYVAVTTTGEVIHDIVSLQSSDPSTAILTVPGFISEYAGSSVGIADDQKDYATYIIKLTKVTYTMTGFEASGSGVKAKGSNYTFDNTADTATFITWDGETPDKSLLDIDDACMLYDSVKCLNKINTEPVADGTYYTYYMIINESDDNALDFSELSAPKCKLDVPGYITDCANIEIGELPSHCEYVIITFRMVKYPANTLIGFAAAATGVVQQGTGYRLTNVDPVSSYPIWSEEVDPSLFDMSFDHRLFTDESCYNELKTEPTVGETYYVYYWLTNETPNDHSLVFDRLLTSDCTLDLTGYRTECVGITPQETAGGNDALQITFSISPKAAYTVTGYNATATSISKTADDTYTLNFDSAFRNGFSWEDGNVPASSACQVLMSTIYTDQTFTSQSALRYEPVSGQDIYMRFTLRNPVADDHSVDFSRITADDCSLTLDGFTVECIGVTKGDGAKDYILVTFKLTKDVPAPDHVLSGFNVDASGVVQNGNDIYSVMFKPMGSIFKSASWDGTAPSESALMCREGFLYSEASCENELMTEPVAGSTYYVRYSIMNTTMSDHSIDFTKLKGTDCTMTLPGYTVSGAAVTVSTHMSRDIVYIVYTVTKDAEVVPNAIVGISLDNAQELANDGTGYYPDIDQDLNDCLYWDDYDNIPSGGVFDVASGYLCSDADCENILTAEPSVASESYITYTISSTLPSSKLDLSGIEKEYCELIVQDYRCTCVAVYYSEDTAGCGTAKITFELVRLPDVYAMTGIEAEATGVSLNDFFYQVDLNGNLASAASWQYDITPYLGNIESSENGALFYNESCEGFVYDAPFDHGVYYVKLSMNNKIAGSHYIDFSKLSTENCSLTLDGYSSECISVTLTDTENHDGVELVFRLVKAADEPYPYAVSGFDSVETGLELVSGAYKPASGENAKAFVSWADDKAATSFYAAPLAVCTDEACTTQLTKEPEAGDVCYVRYVVGNNISLNHDIDFMSLTADDCTLDLEGYTSECLSVKYATDYLSRDEITILFKVTKEEDVVYVMTGADITSTGIVKNGTEYYVPAHDSKISSFVDWKDDVAPEASVFYADVTNLYLDDNYGKLLRSEPVPGHTYYVSYVFRNQVNNAHDIDFAQLTADDLTLKLDGYTTKCISIQCVDDERDTTFAMFSIKKDAEPTPTATATPTPTAKPTATATPKATATAKPTATPKATVTAKPTATPTVKVTATPVPTTKVTATPKPSEKVTPTITPTTAPDVTPTTAPSEDPKVQILDFVKRIYIYVLDREPEKEGSEYWSNELYNFNRTGAEVAQGFIFSEEFSNRGTSDRQFVEILYKTFFGRDADEAGINFWLEQLSTGTMDRVTVANGFIYSQEWADTCASYGIRSGGDLKPQGEIKPTALTYAFVERMYTTAMGRGYDEQGRQYWAGELANFNITGEQVGASFFLSEEMINYKLSDQEYLNRLYATFMNREADADGSAYWLGLMASGTPRSDIVYGFTRSPEFTAKCIEARILPY